MSDGGIEYSEANSDSFLVADGYLSDLEGIHAEEENASQEAAALQMGNPSNLICTRCQLSVVH